MYTPKKNQTYSYNVKMVSNWFTVFVHLFILLTIINLYVHLLPVTDDGHNNTKKSTSNSTTEKKNDQKKDDTWGNDENTTEQENEQKEDETGENDDDALLDNV